MSEQVGPQVDNAPGDAKPACAGHQKWFPPDVARPGRAGGQGGDAKQQGQADRVLEEVMTKSGIPASRSWALPAGLHRACADAGCAAGPGERLRLSSYSWLCFPLLPAN